MTNTNVKIIRFGLTQVEFIDIAGRSATGQTDLVNNVIIALERIACLTGKRLSIKIIPANDRVLVKYMYSGETNEYYEIPEDKFKDKILGLAYVDPTALKSKIVREYGNTSAYL